MLSLSEITDKVRAAVGADSGLGKSLKFDFGPDGVLLIDGGKVSNEDGPTDLTLGVTLADLEAMARGQLDPTSAVMGGRLRVSDLGVAMALQSKLSALFSRLS